MPSAELTQKILNSIKTWEIKSVHKNTTIKVTQKLVMITFTKLITTKQTPTSINPIKATQSLKAKAWSCNKTSWQLIWKIKFNKEVRVLVHSTNTQRVTRTRILYSNLLIKDLWVKILIREISYWLNKMLMKEGKVNCRAKVVVGWVLEGC